MSGASGHVVAPEPTSVGRRGPSHWTRGSARAYIGKEAGSGAVEHATVLELTLPKKQGPEPLDT
jgi:hypothetical protein